MDQIPEKRSFVTFEDAPVAVHNDLVRLIGKNVNVSIQATIKRVGSKAVVLEVESLYRESGEISVPIAHLVINV